MNTKEQINWEEHCERVKKIFSSELKTNDKLYNNFTSSDKRFVLVSCIQEVEKEFKIRSGKITGYAWFYIYADTPETLVSLWEDILSKASYETTTQHLIIDTKERKVVHFLHTAL